MADDTAPVITGEMNEALIQLYGRVMQMSGLPLGDVVAQTRAEIHALISATQKAQRFCVIAEHDPHGGDGWTLFDRTEGRATGGWFADRIAADRTADTLNAS